jgi:hypothetical protein
LRVSPTSCGQQEFVDSFVDKDQTSKLANGPSSTSC